MPPDVTYNNGELLIVAKNSTLGDILNAIQSRTGATIEVSSGDTSERVAGRIGPGAARDVIADLLNGSHFNYVMLSRAGDPAALERVMLSPRGATVPSGSPAYISSQTAPTIVPTIVQGQGPAPIVPPVQEGEAAEDANTENAAENPEENQDSQNGGSEAQPETQPEEQPQPGNPQGVRTPEQMLQQLQQQQLLQQQQQQPPQPGAPPQQQ